MDTVLHMRFATLYTFRKKITNRCCLLSFSELMLSKQVGLHLSSTISPSLQHCIMKHTWNWLLGCKNKVGGPALWSSNYPCTRLAKRNIKIMSKFSSLGLGDWLVRQISAVGFKDPKLVQVQCIPPILEGVVCSKMYCKMFYKHNTFY